VIESPDRRITPWVGRLLAINAVVLLLQQTIFTSDSLAQLLAFDSSLVLQRPWTLVTYMFVHAGILHLAANSLALFVFGPPVERRFGSPTFIAYYMLCGIGAALFTMCLHTFGLGHVPPPVPTPGSFDGIVGASGAIVGVGYAFARLYPDAQMMVFPIPMPIKAKWLILFLAAFDVVGLLVIHDGIAHEAHLGGLLAGVAYFVVRGIGRPLDTIRLPSIRPRVPVAARGGSGTSQQPMASTTTTGAAPAQPVSERQRGVDEAVEIDRVLDKISATGIDSLSAEERRFLDGVARRRRDMN
jgi:membrane associated rhomboid family serine protease